MNENDKIRSTSDSLSEVEQKCPPGFEHYMTLQADEDACHDDVNALALCRMADGAVALYEEVMEDAEPTEYPQEFQYQSLLRQILTEGVRSGNRTSQETKSVFGTQMRFDLSSGFPLLTCKRVPFRWVVEELLLFLRGESDASVLLDAGVPIWEGNTTRDFLDKRGLYHLQEGNMGNGYGKMWRDWTPPREPIPVKVRRKEKHGELPEFPVQFPLEDYEPNHTRSGEIFQSNNCGPVEILQKVRGKRGRFLCRFQNTGAMCEFGAAQITQGSVKDTYQRTVRGVGYLGALRSADTQELRRLRQIWDDMLRRCYDTSSVSYYNYGARGVFVDPHWHSFDNFVRDVKTLPQFRKWRKDPTRFQLDKDYFAANYYGPDSCVWLERRDNTVYVDARPFQVFNDEGDVLLLAISQTEAADILGISVGSVNNGLQRKHDSRHGYRFEYVQHGHDVVYRYPLAVDQIQNAIRSLKENPNDRRNITVAFNPGEQAAVALPPCHVLFQLYVKEGRLSLGWYQRSVDVWNGLPANMASYALLVHIFANVSGLEVGELVFTGGDTHLYEPAWGPANEVYERELRQPPRLRIKKNLQNITDIEELTFEDFELQGYDPHPNIKVPMAI